MIWTRNAKIAPVRLTIDRGDHHYLKTVFLVRNGKGEYIDAYLGDRPRPHRRGERAVPLSFDQKRAMCRSLSFDRDGKATVCFDPVSGELMNSP